VPSKHKGSPDLDAAAPIGLSLTTNSIHECWEDLHMPRDGADTSPQFDRRPWGTFIVLDEGENFKVKRIEVLPGKRLSYQKHSKRAEHWVVVQGTANVTLDDREIIVSTGEAIDIATGSAHRVENPGTDMLVFIEVQRGSYLGEDDIVRLQDDFGRAEKN
jgi:mannose-6-phosphate isomerase